MIYNSMLELVGNTPIVKLNKIKEKYGLSSNLYVKLEMFNASGSVKVRIAKNIIEDAMSKRVINQDTLIVEPTSGNTGVGLAFVCSCLGLNFMAVMPENMSIERRKLIKAYGGKVLLTPTELGMQGSVDEVNRIKNDKDNVFVPSQFDNLLNPLTHEKYTGSELYNQMDRNIDILVCGIGTGGTITGLGRYLKKQKDIRVIGVEPKSSPLLTKGVTGSHKIEGIGANFIPKVLDIKVIDEIITISHHTP